MRRSAGERFSLNFWGAEQLRNMLGSHPDIGQERPLRRDDRDSLAVRGERYPALGLDSWRSLLLADTLAA